MLLMGRETTDQGRFWGADTMRDRRAQGLPKALPCPADFEATFVRIGRLACEEHYRVGRFTVDRWLEKCGKHGLIAKREELVKARVEERRINRRDVGRILSSVYPVQHEPIVSDEVASKAAQFLRVRRNGGWPVSRSPEGFWWVGTSLKTAAEMVEFAKAKGFSANLTGDKHVGG